MTDSDSEEEMELPVIKTRAASQKPLNNSTGSGLPPPNIGTPIKRPTAPSTPVAVSRISMAPKIQKSTSENVQSFPTALAAVTRSSSQSDHSQEVCFFPTLLRT